MGKLRFTTAPSYHDANAHGVVGIGQPTGDAFIVFYAEAGARHDQASVPCPESRLIQVVAEMVETHLLSNPDSSVAQ